MKDQKAALRECAETLRHQRPHSWEEFPDFPLYMDQLLAYINNQQIITADDDDGLTAAMVNNYTKSGLVPRAEGKKYSRDHIAYLTAVCTLKHALAARDLDLLLREELRGESNVEQGYRRLCRTLDRVLNEISGEMDDVSGRLSLADGAIHFAVLSYAAAVAGSRYLTLLKEEKAEELAEERQRELEAKELKKQSRRSAKKKKSEDEETHE